MRARLGESLRHVAERGRGHLRFPEPSFAALLARIERGPVSPQVFGAYADLVLAIDEGALEEATARLEEIVSIPEAGPGLRVLALADPARDAASDRYVRFVNTDPTLTFDILPPPRDRAEACRGLIDAAFERLDAGHAELAAEVRALLREIVLAAGPEAPTDVTFDGASSFLLWGAIVLNVAEHRTPLQMLQALAHESGHNLLFGLSADGPLVHDDDDALYESPLRFDPRPLDGIYHATFVCARMHQALARLLEAGVLDDEERAEAAEALAQNAQLFARGFETLGRHAHPTPLGAAVLKGAQAYMEGAAAATPARV